MTTQITQSVISANSNCAENYSGLVFLRTRTNANVITSLEGRTTGTNVKFLVNGTGPSYEDYKMRRKAEVLKFRNGVNAPGVDTSGRNSFKDVVKRGSNFSQAKLKQLLGENCTNTTLIISSPSKSGVYINNSPGYYLDTNVIYYPSL